MHRQRTSTASSHKGYTLIELLLTITIIAILVVFIFIGVQQGLLRARKSNCAGLMREVGNGITAYMADHYAKTPAPATKKEWDVVYGDPGGNYSTEWLVAVLGGRQGVFKETDGSTSDSKGANEDGTVYVEFPVKGERRGGIFIEPDGSAKFWDPWGRELMIVINSPIQSTYAAGGFSDEVLHTWGLCEYQDTKVDARPFAAISLGADGLKGVGKGTPFDGSQIFAKSDDVISW
jgi:prepilin-type N-terminal cleavage/methylation domain-containing protein